MKLNVWIHFWNIPLTDRQTHTHKSIAINPNTNEPLTKCNSCECTCSISCPMRGCLINIYIFLIWWLLKIIWWVFKIISLQTSGFTYYIKHLKCNYRKVPFPMFFVSFSCFFFVPDKFIAIKTGLHIHAWSFHYRSVIIWVSCILMRFQSSCRRHQTGCIQRSLK